MAETDSPATAKVRPATGTIREDRDAGGHDDIGPGSCSVGSKSSTTALPTWSTVSVGPR
jgi:hypothetical protein